MLFTWAVAGAGLYSTIIFYLWYYLFVSCANSTRFSEAPCWLVLSIAPHLFVSVCGWISRQSKAPAMLVLMCAIWIAGWSTVSIGKGDQCYRKHVIQFEEGFVEEEQTVDGKVQISKVNNVVWGGTLYGFQLGIYYMLIVQFPALWFASGGSLAAVMDRRRKPTELAIRHLNR